MEQKPKLKCKQCYREITVAESQEEDFVRWKKEKNLENGKKNKNRKKKTKNLKEHRAN